MSTDLLVKVFEHNLWANIQIIETCSTLSDDQLDREPDSATRGSIRLTLWHLMRAEQSYLSILTGEERSFTWEDVPPFSELVDSANITGRGLVRLAEKGFGDSQRPFIQTSDGYQVEPWVVMVQVINHATEHREQIKSMLSAQGITPPDLDGWTYGEESGALIQASS